METGRHPSEESVLLGAVKTLAEQQHNKNALPKTQHHPSSLGKRLREIREQYIASGGSLLSMDQLDQEMAERRGERYVEE